MNYKIKIIIDNVFRNDELENKIHSLGAHICKKYGLSDCIFKIDDKDLVLILANSENPKRKSYSSNYIEQDLINNNKFK